MTASGFRFARFRPRWLWPLGAVLIAGCSAMQALNPWHRNNALEVISFDVASDANNGTAFDIHLVFIWDADLANSYTDFTAHNYFKAYREQRLQSNPKLDIVPFESSAQVPTVIRYEVPSRYEEAWAVVVFADYIDFDLNAFPVSDYEQVRLRFSNKGITAVVPKED